MFYAKKKRLHVAVWDSLNEPMEIATGSEWKHEGNQQNARSLTTGDTGQGHYWYGAPDRATLDKRLAEGWPEGSERLLKLAAPEAHSTSIRRRRERADQGSEIDMQAVWRGDLSRAWTRQRRRSVNAPRNVAIIIDLCANAGVGADELFWRGASALRVAQSLTDAGYQVAIYGAEGGKNNDQRGTVDAVQFVEIKAQDQPLDIDKLAALTAMPGYFRTRLFAGIVRLCDLAGKEVSGGYGQAAPELLNDALKLVPQIPATAILQDASVLCERSAAKWIEKAMQQIEGPVKQAA
jgi:hypothetical protein